MQRWAKAYLRLMGLVSANWVDLRSLQVINTYLQRDNCTSEHRHGRRHSLSRNECLADGEWTTARRRTILERYLVQLLTE